MLFFNKVDVYIGYSMEELAKVRAILKREGIKYTYKVNDSSGKWYFKRKLWKQVCLNVI